MGLRRTIEEDLAESIEDPDDFGQEIFLVDPDGAQWGPYHGMILYDTRKADAIGIPIMVHTPTVVLRRSRLERVPDETEKHRWAVRIPISPVDGAPVYTFIVEHISEDGGSIGYVKLNLGRPIQS